MNRTVVALASLTIAIGGAAAAAESAETAVEEAVGNARRSDADRARDKTSKPAAVLEFFGIEPGMHVLDLISGGGYYTEILSGAVGPDGEVVVVAHTNDIIEKYSKKDLAERYRGNRLLNVKRLISNPPDLKLPREAFDLVLMIMVYHDIYYVSESNPNHPKIDRDLFLAQIRRSLKPGGILAIVDHAAMPGTGRGAAQELHRIDEEFAKRDIEAAGFVFDGESSVLRNPGDDKTMLVFDERVRRRTDRFVYRFVKSGAPDWDASSFYRALGFSLVESDPHATHELSLRPNALHRS